MSFYFEPLSVVRNVSRLHGAEVSGKACAQRLWFGERFDRLRSWIPTAGTTAGASARFSSGPRPIQLAVEENTMYGSKTAATADRDVLESFFWSGRTGEGKL